MLQKPLEPFKEKPQRDILEHVFQEAFGNPLELDSVPTAGTPLIEANEWGKNGSDLYIRIGSNIMKFTADEVIAVS